MTLTSDVNLNEASTSFRNEKEINKGTLYYFFPNLDKCHVILQLNKTPISFQTKELHSRASCPSSFGMSLLPLQIKEIDYGKDNRRGNENES